MSLTTSEMTPADLAAVCGNKNDDGFGFGGNGAWWIIILLLFGWGGRGFGGFGGAQGGYGVPCGIPATQADLAAGFNNSTVLSNLNDLVLGQANIQQTLCQGFGGVNTAIMQNGYNTQAGINTLSHQIADCCCTTQRAIDGVRYDMATQSCAVQNTIQNTTRDVIDNQNANARAILDAMNAQRLADKDERIAEQNQKIFALELAASQANQNAVLTAAMDANKAEILRRTGAECPSPAYLVNAPTPINFPLNACGQVQFGGCGGCNGF